MDLDEDASVNASDCFFLAEILEEQLEMLPEMAHSLAWYVQKKDQHIQVYEVLERLEAADTLEDFEASENLVTVVGDIMREEKLEEHLVQASMALVRDGYSGSLNDLLKTVKALA
jgi:hypothetical protein